MTHCPDNVIPAPAIKVQALRDAVAVVLSSAELLQRHIDRLPRATRDRQLAVLLAAAAEIQSSVEAMLEAAS